MQSIAKEMNLLACAQWLGGVYVYLVRVMAVISGECMNRYISIEASII